MPEAAKSIARRELDTLTSRVEKHTGRPVRAACGHFTELVWKATGECFACHVAALWSEQRAAAVRAENARNSS